MHDRVRLRVGEQLRGDAVRREHGEPLGRLVLLAHRHPGVGDHHVGTGHRLDRVGRLRLRCRRSAPPMAVAASNISVAGT